MKNAIEILKNQNITIKDLLSDKAEEKIVNYGWKCMVEIVNEMAINNEQKAKILRQIRIKGIYQV